MAQPTPEISAVKLSLETYWVLAKQRTLSGEATSPAGTGIHLRLIHGGDEAVVWGTTLIGAADNAPVGFDIPVGDLPGGNYRLEARADDARPTAAAVPLAIGQTRRAASDAGSPSPDRYLTFAKQTIDRILKEQTVRLGGRADGVPFVTGGNRVSRSYRSLGHKVDGKYKTYWFPEPPFEAETFRMDIDAWPVLDRLARVTGDSAYRAWVDRMIDAFVEHGFDEKSGLPYFAEEADFDVLRIRAVARGGYDVPKFKPSFSGDNLTLSLDRLWQRAPQQMHRASRAAFLGLITDPARMDYNRFCFYDFSDADGKHALEPSTAHCAFDAAGGAMIHLWAIAFAHTSDGDCLDWAQRLADKWLAVQHPQSGLVPNFFGAQAPGQGEFPLPGQWAECRGGAYAALLWASAAAHLRNNAGAEALARQLTEMSRRLGRGIARYAFDDQRRVFTESLNLDGSRCAGTTRYCFRTQAEKDAAVAQDPAMKQVFVWDGTGLYRNASFWEHFAGSHVPWHLSRVAELTGDRELADLLAPIAKAAVEESSTQPHPFTDEGRWTFRASGEYIRVLLALYRMTRDSSFLRDAQAIADQELARIDQIVYPHWWRLSDRAPLLDALLELHSHSTQDRVQH